jgi:uncharacterized protein YbjT (DUF2867 family)
LKELAMILITGATGNVGRELVWLLQDKGMPLRALVQDPQKATGLTAEGIEVVTADFDRVDGLRKALAGADKLFLLTPASPNLVEHQKRIIDAAIKARVKYVVKLSGLGASSDSSSRLARSHAVIEDHLEQSGLPCTQLRPHFFMQNFLMFAPTITAEGAFYAPMKNGRIAIVDARDVASVAAKILTEDGHEGRTYELTGPEALSFREMGEKLSAVQRRRVAYVDISLEAARKSMLASGTPEWLADAIVELYEIYSEDLAADVSDAIERISGQRPHSFDEFAVDFAETFRRIKNQTLI